MISIRIYKQYILSPLDVTSLEYPIIIYVNNELKNILTRQLLVTQNNVILFFLNRSFYLKNFIFIFKIPAFILYDFSQTINW